MSKKLTIEVDIEDRDHARAVAEQLHAAAEDLPLGMSDMTPQLSTLRARTSITLAQLGLAIALASTGCATDGVGGEVAWTDVPTATITAYAAPALQTDFSRYVELAAGRWNRLLVERGCEPAFVVGAEGHAITLVPTAAWGYGERDGWTDEEQINVVGDAIPPEQLLLHELGHAIGLGHVDGEKSIMSEPIGLGIYPRDVEAAASVMGCP